MCVLSTKEKVWGILISKGSKTHNTKKAICLPFKSVIRFSDEGAQNSSSVDMCSIDPGNRRNCNEMMTEVHKDINNIPWCQIVTSIWWTLNKSDGKIKSSVNFSKSVRPGAEMKLMMRSMKFCDWPVGLHNVYLKRIQWLHPTSCQLENDIIIIITRCIRRR